MDTIKYCGINICYTRDTDLSKQAKELLKDYYMLEHETSLTTLKLHGYLSKVVGSVVIGQM